MYSSWYLLHQKSTTVNLESKRELLKGAKSAIELKTKLENKNWAGAKGDKSKPGSASIMAARDLAFGTIVSECSPPDTGV